MTALQSVRLAVGTLTVLPVGPVDRVSAPVARAAMILAPLAVLPVAVAAAAAGWLIGQAGAPPLLVGVVVVTAMAVGTRAVHLDGLADTVDGLGSGAAPEPALAIMRRGDVGPMGAVALFVVLAGQAAAAGQLVDGLRGAVALAVALSCARGALLLLCAEGVPSARADGLGAAVAGVVPRAAGAVGWALLALALAGAASLTGRPWPQGLLAAGAAVAAVAILRWRCRRRLGGITGDVLGAGVEIAATVLIVGLAL